MSAPRTDAQGERRGVAFWLAAVGGWAMIAIGVRGLADDRVDLVGFARWFIGAAVVHDACVTPAVLVAAWLVGRVVPGVAVLPVRLGLATSALVTVFAWPLVRGYGRQASNPTALPLDYARNLVVTLAVIWLAVMAWVVGASIAARRLGVDTEGLPQP